MSIENVYTITSWLFSIAMVCMVGLWIGYGMGYDKGFDVGYDSGFDAPITLEKCKREIRWSYPLYGPDGSFIEQKLADCELMYKERL